MATGEFLAELLPEWCARATRCRRCPCPPGRGARHELDGHPRAGLAAGHPGAGPGRLALHPRAQHADLVAAVDLPEATAQAVRHDPRAVLLRGPLRADARQGRPRSEGHTSELQSLMRISYAVFCLKKKKRPK